MDNLKNMTGIVLYLLNEVPEARNSDYELYFHVCKMLNPATLNTPFGTVLKNRKQMGLPSIETIGRCRRKIRETHPELLGSAEVECGRMNNEQAFREYAKGVE